MATWVFDELPANIVEQELTQRDQFNNDDVSLCDAVVRESIQNSTDARNDMSAPVKVRFAIMELLSRDADELRELLGPINPHLVACGLPPVGAGVGIRLLVIEDFNTRGLTGDIRSKDHDNFSNFWRRHGKSGKAGGAGGRWGLGKLVYSSSSTIRAFFGLTVRAPDPEPVLMGQCVLGNHEIAGRCHVAHGFWFEGRAETDLQLPVRDSGVIGAFVKLCRIARTTQPGLSLVIPYLNGGITTDGIIRAVLNHYYFPVLTGKLVVEVDDTVIDDKSFSAIAAKVFGDATDMSRFRFVEQVAGQLQRPAGYVASPASGAEILSASSFPSDTIKDMQSAFASGALVHVRVPMEVARKGQSRQTTFVELFIGPAPEGAKAQGMFVRGSITVPAEAKYFSGAHAMGALVASDPAIVAFLGDAENPAHTAWNGNAEKLAGWQRASATLKSVRYSLRALHDILVEQVERRDPDALIDFFAISDAGSGSRRANKVRKPVVVPPSQAEKAYRIVRPEPGSFAIVPGPGAAKWSYPKSIRVRVAYDILSGDPFSKHSELDFDFDGGDINVTADGIQIKTQAANVLSLVAETPDFYFQASGFDINRDLIIDAKART